MYCTKMENKYAKIPVSIAKLSYLLGANVSLAEHCNCRSECALSAQNHSTDCDNRKILIELNATLSTILIWWTTTLQARVEFCAIDAFGWLIDDCKIESVLCLVAVACSNPKRVWPTPFIKPINKSHLRRYFQILRNGNEFIFTLDMCSGRTFVWI